jgi:hypothetical protein
VPDEKDEKKEVTAGPKPDPKNDLTPVEPLMARKKSSQSAMVAIGWRTCPECNGDERRDCDVCFDPATQSFARRLPPDEYIKWLQAHPDKK